MTNDEVVTRDPSETEASEPKPIDIEREIDSLRQELDQLVDELDRRRHDAFDWRLQLRKHARPLALGAAVLAGGVLLRVVIRRNRPPAALNERVAMLLRGGEAVVRGPSVPAQLAKNAAMALVSLGVRFAAQRAIDRSRATPPPPPPAPSPP